MGPQHLAFPIRALVVLAALLPNLTPSPLGAQTDTVIRVAGRPVHSGIATLAEELSIGVTSGAEEYMFGEIADVAVGRDGSVFVYDRRMRAVRQYNATGKYLRSFGRAGQGPGEFRAVSGIGVLPDGRVLVWDTSGWRINVYSPGGAVLDTWSTPSGMGASGVSSSARAMLIDTAGIIWLRRSGLLDRERLAIGPERYERRRSDGTVIGTIARPSFPRGELTLTATSPAGRARHTSDLPFSAPIIWRPSPLGYLVTSIPERYAFELLIPQAGVTPRAPATWRAGEPIVSVRRDVRPGPVTRQERDSARNDVVEGMRRLDPAWSWSGPEIPATKPLFEDLAVGMDGRIWIPLIREVTPRLGSAQGPGAGGAGRSAPPPRNLPAREPPTPRPALYNVFEANGTYLGQVQVPPRTTVAVRKGDLVWAVVYDEDDVQTLKRYRIVWR